MTLKMAHIAEWKCTDVATWLKQSGFEQYVPLLCEDHQVDGQTLLLISEADLKQPPVEMKVLGDIKRLMIAIRKLHEINQETVDHSSGGDGCGVPSQIQYVMNSKRWRQDSTESSEPNSKGSEFSLDESHSGKEKELKPEIWKTIVGMIYFLLVTWITAIVMVIVHDRVPDMQTYPPLPDIFLDNVPLIPWAFSMCELSGIVLFVVWVVILVFHKHRFILMRRMFSLFGSVFLLRCITMLITSLSVPGRHLECKARPYGEWKQKLYQASLIWQGGGMSLQGVRTCGDYMFSGHTVVLTLLNFFITEYTPHSLYYLHTFTWVLNLFGIFFILAAHEHYSLDVFIAFYISTRLFLYYHTLANNRALKQDDSQRTRIWFPLFYFFESGVDGIVPNTFEWPFRIPAFLKIFILYIKTKLQCLKDKAI